MTGQYDIAVVGSGFAGSLMAMIARQLGHSVVLLERGTHPRMMIGESSTPLSNLLLEELASCYDLSEVRTLAKWGSWQANHPELACGLKRGFTFFHHEPGQDRTDRSRQLLVAASPHNEIADTHWYRADFDHFLVKQAIKLGADYLDETDLTQFDCSGRGAVLKGTRKGRAVEISARFVVDASGPRGFLYRALKLGERDLPDFPATQALYSYFSGVEQIEKLPAWQSSEHPPYPIDAAAVHHIFDGGWAWVLRFNNGVTSAGVAASDALAQELTLSEGAPGWARLLKRFPLLQEQFSMAQAVQPFRHIPRLAFRSAAIAGGNWALLPSAAGFIDPLLSTGFPLTLLGLQRLAEILERDWAKDSFGAQLQTYSARTDAELLATARLIRALYANMGNFPLFFALTLLYFAAASYSEAAHRLGKKSLAPSFLLHDHPRFGSQCARVLERACSARRGHESEKIIEEVYRIIQPFDVAGLGNQNRRNWYPVDAEDLLSSAHKLNARPDEILQMLDRCGFYASTSPA